MRVAAAQFAVTNDLDANLATCLRMIRQAAEVSPDLIQLPEFCNHNSWYDDADYCYQVSVDLDGPFLQAIAEAANAANAYVIINCTVRRANNIVTGTSLLYSPEGELLAENDKQVLVGHENDFLQPAQKAGPIIETPFGKLGMYSCMDGVINETPRGLAMRGAQLLCNSLNSFAFDEGTLHIPVRAAENKVFVVAANKVGPLIPEAVLAPVAEAINIPVPFLSGAGDSQIVAPDGTVLAIAGREEEVIWADIDLSYTENKHRPDGTDIISSRRPELYHPLADDPATQVLPEMDAPTQMQAACIAPASADLAALLRQIQDVQQQGTRLLALPPLAGLYAVPTDGQQAEALVASCQTLLSQLSEICLPETILSTSLVLHTDTGLGHAAVLIGKAGLLFKQLPVHKSQHEAWSVKCDQFDYFDSPYGRLACLLEADSIYPEAFRLLAMQGVQIALLPYEHQEAWQLGTGLLERSAENRINLLVAGTTPAQQLITALQHDFTLMTPWKTRQFDGWLCHPEFSRGSDTPILSRTIYPSASHNKVTSHRTHVINSRPWHLLRTMQICE